MPGANVALNITAGKAEDSKMGHGAWRSILPLCIHTVRHVVQERDDTMRSQRK